MVLKMPCPFPRIISDEKLGGRQISERRTVSHLISVLISHRRGPDWIMDERILGSTIRFSIVSVAIPEMDGEYFYLLVAWSGDLFIFFAG
jgi:hypothetical protein